MTRILVIDDEKPTLSMFRLFLAAYGYEVFTAQSGAEGLTIFKAHHPEIVFTDIKMPGMDGLTVLKEIRSLDRASQIIVITGHGDLEKAMEAMDLDASDFINKPVDRQALDAALDRAEKRRQLPAGMRFTVSRKTGTPDLVFILSGRFTGQDPDLLFEQITRNKITDQTVILDMDAGFSINRAGIAGLIRTIERLRGQNIRVVLKNVSCNFSRLFKMVGLDKLADIREARVED
ncbi:MAG: response regulator [Thermodesulfobacteriota bacterium]